MDKSGSPSADGRKGLGRRDRQAVVLVTTCSFALGCGLLTLSAGENSEDTLGGLLSDFILSRIGASNTTTTRRHRLRTVGALGFKGSELLDFCDLVLGEFHH